MSDQKKCPGCSSTNVSFDENYGFYKCLDCFKVWAFDAEDPDYEEEIDLNELLEDSPA